MRPASDSRLTPALAPGVRRREVWAWAMYDFANSGYTTIVITAVFNAWFVSGIARNAQWATLSWTSALSVSYALIMATAPALGAWADAHAAKKRLLLTTTVGCVAATAALALAGPGDVVLALVLVVVSNYFFGSGENLVAAFLPELASADGLGRVSGWGWALGYVGGLVSLALSLGWLAWAEAHGVANETTVPMTLVITALLFATASLPTFLLLRERAAPRGGPVARRALAGALARLRQGLRDTGHYVDMRRFLVCIVFYQAGIQAVVALAGIYAQQAMGFTLPQIITLIAVVNVTAVLGALAFGHLQDRLGHVRTLALTLLGWIAMVLLAWAATTPPLFWVSANLAGLCMGASQSAGRALVGWLAPRARRAEFFGLWGFAVKLSSILGPLTYGLASWLSGGDHRFAILLTGSYFLVGLLVLAGIDVARGRREALSGTAS